MADSRRTGSINTFEKGMNQDSLLSMQLNGTYREAWSAVTESDDANSFGLTNEASNALFVEIPEGFDVRGIAYAEERNQYIVMLYNPKRDFSEIGIVDELSKKYTKKISDNELRDKLCFGQEFMDVTLKNTGQCSPLEVYWTNKDTFRYIDLDDPNICNWRLEDTELFKCDCAPSIVSYVAENGGALPNGIYQFFARLEDAEGNATNFFEVGNPVSIGDGDFVPGEISRQAIQLNISGFKSRYDKVALGVVRTIGGVTSADLITTSYHGNGNFYYVYRNVADKERAIDIQEILSRKDGYIKGKGISQYDGRLLLYNVRGKRNLDYQRRANNIIAKYGKWRVPIKFAHQFKQLRPWEKYGFGIKWNFCDGTSTSNYYISGRACKESDLLSVDKDADSNCSSCDLPRWRVEDTSERTDLFGSDPKVISKNTKQKPTAGNSGYKIDDKTIIPTDDPNTDEEKEIDDNLDCMCAALGEQIQALIFECDECEALSVLTNVDLISLWCICKERNTPGGGGGTSPGGALPITINGVELLDPGFTEEQIEQLTTSESVLNKAKTFYGCSGGSCGSASSSNSSSNCGSCSGTGVCYECNGNGQCNSGSCSASSELCDSSSACSSCGGGGSCSTCKGSGTIETFVNWYEVERSFNEAMKLLNSENAIVDGHRAYDTGNVCDCEGKYRIVAGSAMVCKSGTWHLLDHIKIQEAAGEFTRNGSDFYPSDEIAPLVAACPPIRVSLFTSVCKDGGDSWELNVTTGGSAVTKIEGTVTSPVESIPFLVTNRTYASGKLNTGAFNRGDPYAVEVSFVVVTSDGCKYASALESIPIVGKPILCQESVEISVSGTGGNGGGGGGGGGNEDPKGPCNDLKFEYVYDEDGCEIIGVKPLKLSEGTFGFWETEETYPLTKDCNGDYIYGDLAGKRVRLHATPGNNKEPHFLSCQNGVPFDLDPANSEFDSTYIDFIGVIFEGIVAPNPEELDKPLCKENPFTITIIPRTENDTSVLSSGLFLNTFKGTIQNEDYAIGKHAVNSCEYYDRSIEPAGASAFRGGDTIDVPAYIHHSPDLHLLRRNIGDAYNVVFDLEINGAGYTYHHYFKGEAPESPTVGRRNRKGTTQHIHLNHYENPIDAGGVHKCVKAVDYVPADSVLAKSDRFTYSLLNLWRESSVYLELEGDKVRLVNSIEAYAPGSQYGGRNPAEDNTSDASFLGNTIIQDGVIYHAACHYGHIIRYLPHQYGSLVSQTYEPLLEGTAADLSCGRVEGVVGDSFCNYFSVKRTGYVSDKVPSDISPEIAVNVGPNLRFLKSILRRIFNSIGVENCGTVPVNGIADGRTNEPAASLRVGKWGGTGTLPAPSGTDIYYPALLNTNILTYIPADVNTYFRQTGDINQNEIYYPRLKSLKLDSKFPYGTDADKAYLDRFFFQSNENPMYKMVLRIIFNFLFTFGIMLWIVIQGFGMLGGGSWGLQTALAIVVIGIGIAWAIYWANADYDNRFWDNILGIDGCWPDLVMPDNSYKMKDGRVQNFEDNYWKYNLDYSKTNTIETTYGMADPYNTCDCLGDYKSLLLYSAKQRIGSPVNSWLNFKINDYDEIPTDNGKITGVFQLGNRLYIKTSDGVIDMLSGNRELALGEGDNIFLSNGDLFHGANPLAGGIVEGYAGDIDPNAAISTDLGHFYIDRKAKKIYQFASNVPKPISDVGMRSFFKKNLGLFLVEQFPDFKYVDNKHPLGVGYSLGIDHRLNRLLVTKIDYKCYEPEDLILQADGYSFKTKRGKIVYVDDEEYFCNKSFTISYDLVRNTWIGFHYYHPRLYAWNRYDLYSFDPMGLWKHNQEGSWQTFYGEYFPFSVEYVINEQSSYDAFSFVSSAVDAEFYTWKDYDYIRNTDTFFTKILAFNSHQSTGEAEFRNTRLENILEATREVKDTVDTTFRLRKWSFDGLKDKLNSVSEHILDNDCVIGPRPINKNNHGSLTNNKLVDNYLVNRLIYSKFAPDAATKIYLKSITSEIERETA